MNGVQPPKIYDPIQAAIQFQQIRLMRQQTELLRQQTEALRQQNGGQTRSVPQPRSAARETAWEQTGPEWQPEIGASCPYIRYMSLEGRQDLLVTMPTPTGNPKRDERAWDKWWRRFDARIQDALPAWSPEAYQKVRAMFALLDGSVLR